MSSVPCMLTENLSILMSRAPGNEVSTPVPVQGESSDLGLVVSLTALAWLALAAARRLSRPIVLFRWITKRVIKLIIVEAKSAGHALSGQRADEITVLAELESVIFLVILS